MNDIIRVWCYCRAHLAVLGTVLLGVESVGVASGPSVFKLLASKVCGVEIELENQIISIASTWCQQALGCEGHTEV